MPKTSWTLLPESAKSHRHSSHKATELHKRTTQPNLVWINTHRHTTGAIAQPIQTQENHLWSVVRPRSFFVRIQNGFEETRTFETVGTGLTLVVATKSADPLNGYLILWEKQVLDPFQGCPHVLHTFGANTQRPWMGMCFTMCSWNLLREEALPIWSKNQLAMGCWFDSQKLGFHLNQTGLTLTTSFGGVRQRLRRQCLDGEGVVWALVNWGWNGTRKAMIG